MKVKQNILKVLTGLSLGLGIISSGSTLAAVVTYDFTVENLDGSLAGNTYNGYLQYDDSMAANQITGNDFEAVTSFDGGLLFSFDFLGTTFKQTDDESNRTQLGFKNGAIDSLYFRLESDRYDYSDLGYLFAFTSYNTDEFGELYIADFSYLIDGVNGSGGNGDIVFSRRTSNPTSIPEPSSLIGIGAITLGFMVKNRKA